MKPRSSPPVHSWYEIDQAPKEPLSGKMRRERIASRIHTALWLLAFCAAVYSMARFALDQAEAVESHCSTDSECFERYCAQDLSCDGGPEVAR